MITEMHARVRATGRDGMVVLAAVTGDRDWTLSLEPDKALTLADDLTRVAERLRDEVA